MEMPKVASPPTSQSVMESWAHTQLMVVTYSFKWTIDNFSNSCEETGEIILSPTLPPDYGKNEPKWQIVLYPRGNCEECNDWLSLFLRLVSLRKVRAKFKFSLLDASKEEINIHESSKVREFSTSSEWGFRNFIRRDFLLETTGVLLLQDKLTVCCEVRVFADPVNASGQNIQVTKCPLPQELGQLFESQKLSDVILVSANGHEFGAHKAILAARSLVFSDMFEFEMKESLQGRVMMTDMDHEVLQEMLQYIYTGKVSNMQKRPQDLMLAADKYALDHLKVMCGDHLHRTLSILNAAGTLVVADVCSADLLKSGAINFINTHAIEVMATYGWRWMEQIRPQLVAEVARALAGQLKPPNSPPQKRQKL